MKSIFITVVLFFIFTSQALHSETKQVTHGAHRIELIKELLKDKRVGLIVNQTSIIEHTKTHLLDTLLASGVNVTKIFAPEHGIRGDEDAGAVINDSKDVRTGLPIISIYGKNKKPSPEMIKDLDVIVFDIQDVGARFYTYISTMQYAMEACAENKKEFIVLDRPNPNDYVDGPVRKEGFQSFVGLAPIPVLHGLTVGELATMISGEGWLQCKDPCNLTVVKMLNWKHGSPYWLPVKPSPNLPTDQSIRLYASLCFFEATKISVGRGTHFPFEVLGYPDEKYGEFTFTPASLPGFDTNPLQKDKLCYGVDLREYPFEGGLSLKFFIDFYKKAGEAERESFFDRARWFDLLAGDDLLRKQIMDGMSEEEIKQSWEAELDEYKEMRKKYLLYEE